MRAHCHPPPPPGMCKEFGQYQPSHRLLYQERRFRRR
jgi:hypothetical protein